MNKFIRIFKCFAPIVLLVAVLALLMYEYKKPDNKFTGMAAIVCRVGDNGTLFEENADMRVAPASLTKLLTASVALKYMSVDEVLTVGTEQELVPNGSSVCLIAPGHRLKLRDLIRGMLMKSGNDAAYTVAVSVARAGIPENLPDSIAVERFCGLMNDLAREIGMTNSRFTTPDGSDSPEQYTTARDLSVLTKYALSFAEIREIVSEYQKYVVFESGENITWENTNRLLNPDDEFYRRDAIGMKTGTTSKAGNCLIAAFSQKGGTYISVVMGCDTDEERYSSTLSLISEYAGL